VLAPGVYDKAQRAPFREEGRPGIDISGDGRGCNEVSGRFEVRSLVVSPGGRLERLWIVYEHHCEGGTAGRFGEVRLGEPGPDGPVGVAPSIVRWPPRDHGGAGAVVPVSVVAAGATQMGAASVAGADPGDYTIRLDECAGQALAPGGPALRASWELRAGDATPLPPWMVSGQGSTGPPVSLDDRTPGAGGPAAGATPQAGQPGAKPAAPCAGAAALPLRRGTSAANRIRGTRRAERILAGAGRDRVRAGAGGDCVDGGAGNDVLHGDAGADALFGGLGTDRLYGGAGFDSLDGGLGGDRLDAGTGSDVVSGGPGRDWLVGGAGADTLRGDAGDDILVGGAGRDRLDCGEGPRDAARGVARGEPARGCERVARARSAR
jgi:hypothetical protein